MKRFYLRDIYIYMMQEKCYNCSLQILHHCISLSKHRVVFSRKKLLYVFGFKTIPLTLALGFCIRVAAFFSDRAIKLSW